MSIENLFNFSIFIFFILEILARFKYVQLHDLSELNHFLFNALPLAL